LYGTGAGSVSGLFGVWGGQYPYSKDSTTVTYTGAASDEAAVNSFRLGLVDFLTFESPVNDSLIAELDALQLPLVGGGIVAAYNLNTSLGATAVLNLDGATLAAIWAGDVTVWNDSRIVALNPGPVAAGLPNTPITLVLPSASGFGLMDVFTRTLSNFSTDFAAQLSAAGGRLADLPHIQATAIIASNSTAAASQVRVRTHIEMSVIPLKAPRKE
jgi:phosphate transport system substrate-binding protein